MGGLTHSLNIVFTSSVAFLKLFTAHYFLVPGENGVSYVANTGVELFHHAYSTILCCATGVDGITFAYIIRDKDGSRYTCHVFQCLTPEEVGSKQYQTSEAHLKCNRQSSRPHCLYHSALI